MKSNALEKSSNRSVDFRFFTQTPSKIQRIVRICDVVDQFLRKPFWFFSRIFSISDTIWLSSRAANANAQKLKKAQSELTYTYLKEQTEYIQDQINKIQHSVEGRQSRITWQIVNEVNKRKSTMRVKLKAANQEQIHLWKEHLKNLLGKFPKVKWIYHKNYW